MLRSALVFVAGVLVLMLGGMTASAKLADYPVKDYVFCRIQYWDVGPRKYVHESDLSNYRWHGFEECINSKKGE